MDIFYPVFAMFALTMMVTFRLASLRFSAVKNREVDGRIYKAYQQHEPEHIAVTARHLTNLLEIPVLFYVSCVMVFVTNIGSTALLAVAWGFVLSRFAHSYVHLTSNKIVWRFRTFFLSWIALIVMWTMMLAAML